MLQITLGAYGRVEEEEREFAPRSFCGWYRGMSDEDIYTSARAWWVLNRARAERENYAVVTANGTAIQVIEIEDWHTNASDGRHAFSGTILKKGHPVYDRYVGQALTAASRNPIHYIDDPDGPAETVCKCGCKEATSGGTWLPGHD